jgi:hypothetical protein
MTLSRCASWCGKNACSCDGTALLCSAAALAIEVTSAACFHEQSYMTINHNDLCP